MNEILEKIEKTGIVPVVVINDANDAKPLAKALIEGGLPCAEVTFRTEAAEESIKRMSEEYPEMLIGAGTVLTTEQVDRAVKAGAKFIVSPGLNPKVVSYCIEKGITVTPGTSCPSDIEKAIELGLDVVKFFPAEANGGIKSIKAMSAPYTSVRFMPTGGINAKNINDYLSFDKILACGGSWMVPKDLVAKKDFEAITKLTREAVLTMLELKVDRIELKEKNEAEAKLVIQLFSLCSGLVKEAEEDRIIISTRNLKRAKNYFESNGMKISNNIFEEKINGFTIVLEEK